MRINQSQIADAIEQGQETTLHTYTIYGHSDDVLVIEGPNLGSGLEFNNPAGHFLVTVADGEDRQCLVAAQLGYNSQWTIGIQPMDDNALLPIGEYKLTAQGYSAVLTITSPQMLTFEYEE